MTNECPNLNAVVSSPGSGLTVGAAGVVVVAVVGTSSGLMVDTGATFSVTATDTRLVVDWAVDRF